VTRSSAPLRFAAALQNDRPVKETLTDAQLAEDLGYAEVWGNENGHGRGVFTQLGAIAGVTTAVGLGIGIVNPFHRHPSVIAMEAATLDELSDGRLRLGVGAAQWNLRHLGEADARTARPYTATIEALRIIRAMLHGTPSIDSEVFEVRPDTHLDFAPVRPDLPVYLGPVNRRMLRGAGAYADGVELGAIMSVGYVTFASRVIAEGALSQGRDPAALDIAAPLMTAVARDGAVARTAVRAPLAYYLHRVEKVVVDESGADPAAIARVRTAVAQEGPEAASGLVTDELIDTFAVAGTPDQAVARFRQYAAAGIRGLIVQLVPGLDRAEGLELVAKEVIPHVLN
jgi:5,10-methylenetetrahydromethanopterin reductase